jgi:hypothetical protein
MTPFHPNNPVIVLATVVAQADNDITVLSINIIGNGVPKARVQILQERPYPVSSTMFFAYPAGLGNTEPHTFNLSFSRPTGGQSTIIGLQGGVANTSLAVIEFRTNG